MLLSEGKVVVEGQEIRATRKPEPDSYTPYKGGGEFPRLIPVQTGHSNSKQETLLADATTLLRI